MELGNGPFSENNKGVDVITKVLMSARADCLVSLLYFSVFTQVL